MNTPKAMKNDCVSNLLISNTVSQFSIASIKSTLKTNRLFKVFWYNGRRDYPCWFENLTNFRLICGRIVQTGVVNSVQLIHWKVLIQKNNPGTLGMHACIALLLFTLCPQSPVSAMKSALSFIWNRWTWIWQCSITLVVVHLAAAWKWNVQWVAQKG